MSRLFVTAASLLLLLALLAGQGSARPLSTYSPEAQSAQLFYDEAMTIYLGNLERRANNLPPLRWNREMTLAARWFSWDSVENRPDPYCGHTDTLEGWPWDRALRFGYLGFAGAENAYCGYMTPADAIKGWMDSAGHRANLLNATWREVGLGYYRRTSDNRGYIAQVFGTDDVYNPVIINNEAPSTSGETVSLYVYSPGGQGGLLKMGPAQEMMIGRDACFTGSAWQPYRAEIASWSLSAGSGWKNVYVKLRDAWGRTAVSSDMIYRGDSLPTAELNLSQLSRTQSSVSLHGLESGGLPSAQYSLGWMVNDSSFSRLWGDASRVSDNDGVGGTAFRMDGLGGESSIWHYTTSFVTGTPMVAYFRLKTSSNSSAGQVARVQVEANEAAVTLEIKGTDFAASGQYQEFAVPFTFHNNPSKPFLIFQIWASSSATIHADSVSVFTASLPLSGSTYTWNVPGGNYRGQSVWVRYTGGGGAFTGYKEVMTPPLGTDAKQITLLSEPGETSTTAVANVSVYCGSGAWSVKSKPAWLQTSASGSELRAWGSAGEAGDYHGELVLQTSDPTHELRLPVQMIVVPALSREYLPYIGR
jgi:uncharacterized protein YkwD